MSDRRLYSKLKAIAGHVTWTEQEVLQVPFYLDDRLENGTRFAVIKIPGRDMYLQGYRADLRFPGVSKDALVTVQFLNGLNAPISNASLDITGVALCAEKVFSPFLSMPSGSYWKARISIDPSVKSLAGASLTLTYILSYANGPLSNTDAVFTLGNDGIGFWTIGQDFVVS